MEERTRKDAEARTLQQSPRRHHAMTDNAKPSPADTHDNGRDRASLVSGIAVGFVTAIPAWFFLMAATWSSIHGGMSGMMLAVLSLVAMAVPLGCGFLAGRAMYRWWPRRVRAEMTHSSSTMSRDRRATSVPSTPLNCPHCACSMELPADCADTPPYTVVECPIHGPFHFGPGTALTLGRPPQI
jgi:hypothetical protein